LPHVTRRLVDDVMKLFGLLDRGHKPDVDALSALVDGALDGAAAGALGAHVAGCDACAAELDGLRSVKSMLAVLPQVEPSRSFRVRLADVQPPARESGAPASALLRAMPALAAAAAVVFVGVLATDVSTRDGDGDRQATSGIAADRAADGGVAESLSMDERSLPFGTDGDDAAAENGGTVAGGVVAEASPDAASGAPAIAPQPGEAEPPVGDSATGPGSDGAARDEFNESDSATKQAQELDATGQELSSGDDDDGNRMGFLIVEVAAGVLAIGAAAVFVASRRTAQ
jgi:hypothetical protein